LQVIAIFVLSITWLSTSDIGEVNLQACIDSNYTQIPSGHKCKIIPIKGIINLQGKINFKRHLNVFNANLKSWITGWVCSLLNMSKWVRHLSEPNVKQSKLGSCFESGDTSKVKEMTTVMTRILKLPAHLKQNITLIFMTCGCLTKMKKILSSHQSITCQNMEMCISNWLKCYFFTLCRGPSWLYGSWIYNYLCNQCLSPLKLWVRTPFMVSCTQYNIMSDLWHKTKPPTTLCPFSHLYNDVGHRQHKVVSFVKNYFQSFIFISIPERLL
jgi:hypothetical protein